MQERTLSYGIMKKYLNRFMKEENGIETIEFIAMVAVAAALIIVITGIGNSMADKADDVKGKMDAAIDGLNIE